MNTLPTISHNANSSDTYSLALTALASWSRDPELAATINLFEIRRSATATGLNVSITSHQDGAPMHYFAHIPKTASDDQIEKALWRIIAILQSCLPTGGESNRREQGYRHGFQEVLC